MKAHHIDWNAEWYKSAIRPIIECEEPPKYRLDEKQDGEHKSRRKRTIHRGHMKGNAPLNTLKRQPGQSNSYNPKFHPLPGEWAKQQMASGGKSSTKHGSTTLSNSTEIDKARAAEARVHEYWEEWQGVRPGKAVYENPRELQNTLLPSAKYGTEGSGYGS